jgi:Flp pilus assembly protein TadG
MALILPVLLLVLGGIIDLGRAFYGQIIIGNAAREGARMVALNTYTDAQIDLRVTNAMGGLTPLVSSTTGGVTITKTPCPAAPSPTDAGTVRITIATGSTGFKYYMLDAIPRLVGATVPTPSLTATASMKCVS